MTGKGDQTGGAGDQWLAAIHARLSGLIDRTLEVIAASEDPPGDVAAAEKKARAIGVLARSAKAVDALRPRPKADEPRANEPGDDMDRDDSDDIDAGELERLRAELESRLDHLRGVYERKRLAEGIVASPTEGGDPVRPAPA